MPKVSVIVPVYNAEKYLQECVDSILRQTLTDLELILVDDGSTDSSPAICDRYAEQDARVQVIRQANAGLSAARNRGIEVAAGEWVAFVDSDDFIDANMYRTMIIAAEAKGAQLAVCTGYYYSDVRKERMSSVHDTKGFCKCSEDFVRDWLWTSDETTVLFTVVWNKIYQRKFFADDLYFARLRISEDEEFSTRLYLKNFRLVYVDQPFYYYRANVQSLTYRPFAQNKLCILDILYERYEAYQSKGWVRLYRQAAKNFCEMYIECYQKSAEKGNASWLRPYRKEFRLMRAKLGLSGHKKDQVRYSLFLFSPKLYKKLTSMR